MISILYVNQRFHQSVVKPKQTGIRLPACIIVIIIIIMNNGTSSIVWGWVYVVTIHYNEL